MWTLVRCFFFPFKYFLLFFFFVPTPSFPFRLRDIKEGGEGAIQPPSKLEKKKYVIPRDGQRRIRNSLPDGGMYTKLAESRDPRWCASVRSTLGKRPMHWLPAVAPAAADATLMSRALLLLLFFFGRGGIGL